MKFCDNHWQRLRDAIDAAGLTALIAETGEQAVRNLVSEVTDGRTIDNFEPLMMAHNAIVQNCLIAAGGNALVLLADAELCPLCFCNDNDPANATQRVHDYDEWIDLAARDVLAAWKALQP